VVPLPVTASRSPRASDPDRTAELDMWQAYYYCVLRDRILAASVLRARAGRLRDGGGEGASWPEVGRVLQESSRALQAAVQ